MPGDVVGNTSYSANARASSELGASQIPTDTNASRKQVDVPDETAPEGRIPQLIRLWNTSRKSLIGAAFTMAQPLMLNAISIPATAYIIASLGPLDYGEWAVALSLIASTAVLTALGARSAFVRGLSREPTTAPQAFADQLGLRLFLGAFAGAVSLGVCLALGYNGVVLRCTLLLAIGGIFNTVVQVVADLLVAFERLPSMSAINAVGGLSLTIASVIAIWLGAGPFGLAASYMFGPVLSAALSLLLVQRQLFPVRMSWNPRRWWALLTESKIFTGQLLIYGLDTQAANLLVPKLVDVTSYGYFAAGTLVPMRLMVIPDGMSMAFYPGLVRSHAEGPDAFRRHVGRYCLLAGIVGTLAAVPVFFLAGPIARLLFPLHPDVCQTMIQLTIWWVPLVALHTALTASLNAAFREGRETRIAFAAMLVSLVTTAILVATWQLTGAGIALLAKGFINLTFRMPLFFSAMKTPMEKGAPALRSEADVPA